MFVCKRCGLDFSQRGVLREHLKRKNICLPLESDEMPSKQLEELNKKDGIECKDCKRIYKNEECLRKHKCKAIHNVSEMDVIKKILAEQIEINKKFGEKIKMLESNPTTINNNTINNNINNSINNNIENLNVTLNCFMDTSGKPIEYLLNSSDIKEKILKWVKSKTGLLDYIDEKFYNPEHPENMMIKKGKNGEMMKLHISGKWKELNNVKASDLILTNVGNDFMIYLDTIKESDEEYTKNRKVLKCFENDIMKPLEWGIDVSEDSENMITKTIIKNKDGEYVYLEDEENEDRKLIITKGVIKHVHDK